MCLDRAMIAVQDVASQPTAQSVDPLSTMPLAPFSKDTGPYLSFAKTDILPEATTSNGLQQAEELSKVAMRYVRQGSDLEVDKAQEEGSPLVFCNQLYDSAPHIVSATSIASESERYNQDTSGKESMAPPGQEAHARQTQVKVESEDCTPSPISGSTSMDARLQVDELKAQLDQLHAQTAEQQVQHQDLRDRLKETKAVLAKLKAEFRQRPVRDNQQLQDDIKQLQDNLQSVRSDLEKQEARYQEVSRKYKAQKKLLHCKEQAVENAERKAPKGRLQGLQQQLQAANDQLESRQLEIKLLNDENNGLVAELSASGLQHEVSQLQSKLQRAAEEAQGQKNAWSVVQERCRGECDAAHREVAQLREQLAQQPDQQHLIHALADVQNQLQQAHSTAVALQLQLDEERQKREAEEQTVASTQTDAQLAKERERSSHAQLVQVQQAASVAHTAHQDQMAAARQMLHEVEQAHRRTRREIQLLQQHQVGLETRQEAVIQAVVAHHESQIASLQQQLADKDAKSQAAQSREALWQQQLADKDAQLQSAQAQQASLQQQLADMTARLQSAQSQDALLQQQLVDKDAQLQSTQAQQASLQQQLADKDIQLHAAQSQEVCLQQQLKDVHAAQTQQLAAAPDSLAQTCAGKDDRLRTAQEQVSSAQPQLAELHASHGALSAALQVQKAIASESQRQASNHAEHVVNLQQAAAAQEDRHTERAQAYVAEICSLEAALQDADGSKAELPESDCRTDMDKAAMQADLDKGKTNRAPVLAKLQHTSISRSCKQASTQTAIADSYGSAPQPASGPHAVNHKLVPLSTAAPPINLNMPVDTQPTSAHVVLAKSSSKKKMEPDAYGQQRGKVVTSALPGQASNDRTLDPSCNLHAPCLHSSCQKAGCVGVNTRQASKVMPDGVKPKRQTTITATGGGQKADASKAAKEANFKKKSSDSAKGQSSDAIKKADKQAIKKVDKGRNKADKEVVKSKNNQAVSSANKVAKADSTAVEHIGQAANKQLVEEHQKEVVTPADKAAHAKKGVSASNDNLSKAVKKGNQVEGAQLSGSKRTDSKKKKKDISKVARPKRGRPAEIEPSTTTGSFTSKRAKTGHDVSAEAADVYMTDGITF